MKTFTNWLRSFKVKEQPKQTKRAVNPELFKGFADMYNGTDNCDLAGLWETKILRNKC